MDHTILPPKSQLTASQNDAALPREGVVDDELRWFFSKHDGVWASPYHAEMEAQRAPWLPDTEDGEAIAAYYVPALVRLSRALRAYRVAGRK